MRESDSELVSSEVGKDNFCMTHQQSQAQMTDFELYRGEFMKRVRELAIVTSFSLKCHIVVSLRRAAGPLHS